MRAITLIIPRLIVTLALLVQGTTAVAQTTIFKLSRDADAGNTPAASSFAGFGWSFRQQILIDEWRLGKLRGQKLFGFVVRRDLGITREMPGGEVDLEVRLSISPRSAARAETTFANNTGTQLMTAFRGRVILPTSPAIKTTTTKPWAAENSVTVSFPNAYSYAGGTLCIDLFGSPVAGKEPQYWPVDHELDGSRGQDIEFGKSCSDFAVEGITLSAETTGLQIGSTIRLVGFGRLGSTPLLLIGAKAHPTGVSLSPMGAPGCHLYVDYFLSAALAYRASTWLEQPASLEFHAQVPHDLTMMGVSVFFQTADIETAIPSNWTNSAGLTTSNGLELRIANSAPSMGMSVVRSDPLGPMAPWPGLATTVDVEAAPVMRFLY